MRKIFGVLRGLNVKLRGVLIVGLVVSAWVFMSEDSSVQYKTESVSRGSVISTITSVGTLKHFEEVEIHSAIPGTVTEVLKNQNDKVSRGDVLIRLEANALKSHYEKARAELEAKEADFQYQSELYDKHLTSANDYNKTKIAMEQAKAEFSEAARKFKATEIRSPIDGTVIYRAVEVGRAVDNKGGILMKIAGKAGIMKLLIRIGEADIGRISKGQFVHFTVSAFKNQSFTGEIFSVPEAPLEGEGAVTYEVSARVENPEHILKSGMTADITVKTAQVNDVLRMPTAALRFLPLDGSAHASGSAVWVKSPAGKLNLVPVTIGESNEVLTEIKTGEISEGDSVVVGTVVETGEDSGSMALPQPKRF